MKRIELRSPSAVLLPLVIMLLPVLACAQQADPEKKPLPPDVAKAYLSRVRDLCQREPLRGVRVSDCWLNKGSLVLAGLADSEEQLESLREEAGEQVEAIPGLLALVTAGVSVERVSIAPLRSQSLPRLQTAFATRRFTDPDWEAVLRQTRLDDAHFDRSGGLVLKGVCLNDDARAAMTAGERRPDLPAYRMIIEIEDLLQQQMTPPVYRRLGLADNRVEIDFLKNPVAAIQTAVAQRPALDGVLVRSAAYDSQGELRLEGLVESEEQREEFLKFLTSHLKASRVCRSSVEITAAASGLAMFSLDEWRTSLQRGLAESGETRWRKSLVSRAWFQGDGTVAVLVCGLGIDTGSEPYQKEFLKLALEVTGRLAADRPQVGKFVREVVVGGAESWADPVNELRTATAREPKYDGIRVDGAEFDASGGLAYDGVCNSPAQAVDFAQFAATVLKEARSPLAPLPASCKRMRGVSTASMLKELRTWSSQNLDEVWLERLHFSSKGRLRLEGMGIAASDELKCRTRALELLAPHPLANHLLVGDPLETAVRVVQPSLTADLRKLVIEAPDLRGLSIQRGYYDADGLFLVSGVQDKDGQVGLLTKRVNDLPADSEIRLRLPAGLKTDRFAVVLLAQLVTCLNDVMPAFEACDGIRLTEAYHDEQNRLAFRGTRVFPNVKNVKAAESAVLNLSKADYIWTGIETTVQRAESAVLDLLKADPEWGIRVGGGVSLTGLTPIPQHARDEIKSRRADIFGLVRDKKYADAQRQLTEIIQQNPDDSLAWYLRGLCLESDGQLELARRDYLRVVILDRGNPAHAGVRSRSLEGLQGTLRVKADAQIKKVAAELTSGQSVDSLFGVKAWKARNAK